jgi:tetratricopeptide (TPR) repeat protein
MTNDPTAHPQPHDPANPPPRVGAEEFAANVQAFWEKNRNFILLLIATALTIILAREGWQAYRGMRERGIQAEYAKVERIDQLPRFAESHRGHPLAGAAWLRVADDAYSKNDFRSAATNYTKAAEALEQPALKTRARLGVAMSQIAAGDQTTGETALKALSADNKAVATLRAEATYHLATLAHTAGRNDDAKQLLDEVSKIDPTGLWAQRAFGLRAQIDASTANSAAPATAPLIEFKPKG